jgi:hypothetical protein
MPSNDTVWLYVRGSSKIVEVRQLRNVTTPGFINNATVTLTLLDALTEVPVLGQTWPVTLSYVTGSDGTYRATLSYAIDVANRQRLLASYQAESDTLRRVWVQKVLVVDSLP